ncbi:uncharacterized protein LOC124704026 isoform X3 [Lolium rigidum]|uniref:uncharacterized protein LOC124704026 isoform X3 n=1 Tax=Lolium rigidum TaxID=89674 RepID=UPI001F5C64B3|nr:uncharacterized protein LOC124704026 isoform X3 [Lolium rigidum]
MVIYNSSQAAPSMFPLGSTQLHWTMVRLTRLLVLVETKISDWRSCGSAFHFYRAMQKEERKRRSANLFTRTLGRAEHEKSKAAVDFLSLAELWEHFAESGAYGLAVLVRLLGHVLPLRHPAIHSHQPHHLQIPVAAVYGSAST